MCPFLTRYKLQQGSARNVRRSIEDDPRQWKSAAAKGGSRWDAVGGEDGGAHLVEARRRLRVVSMQIRSRADHRIRAGHRRRIGQRRRRDIGRRKGLRWCAPGSRSPRAVRWHPVSSRARDVPAVSPPPRRAHAAVPLPMISPRRALDAPCPSARTRAAATLAVVTLGDRRSNGSSAKSGKLFDPHLLVLDAQLYAQAPDDERQKPFGSLYALSIPSRKK